MIRRKLMNCIFIYNPVSGKGKIAKQLDYIVNSLKKTYSQVDVYATKAAGDMARFASDAIGKYDAIVFAGGDGSFNEILQAIAKAENPPILGYIPSGTANDIGHTLKIPKNVKKALKIIKEGKEAKLDCMKVNDQYAMYVVCAGAFVSATYTTSQKLKNKSGKLAYFLHGAIHNLRLNVFNVECSNKTLSKNLHNVLILFINSRYVASFKVNKQASLCDGKIEVAIIEQKEKPNFFQKIGALFSVAKLFLFGYKVKGKRIVRFEGSKFNVNVNDDIVWNFDGEKGLSGNIDIEVVPEKVRMIVPQNLKRV